MHFTKEELDLLYLVVGIIGVLISVLGYGYLTRHYPYHNFITTKGTVVKMSKDLAGKWWINSYQGPYSSLPEAERAANLIY